jgi:hypothetical protein
MSRRSVLRRAGNFTTRHSGMVRRTRPGISRFPDVQLHIEVRCFASPRNDGPIMTDPISRYALAIPRRNAPELCLNFSPRNQRARGMPGARCTRSLVCSVLVAHECSHHGRTGTPGIPARNGFNGLLRALPGDRAFLSPSSALLLADLTPASRRQDHTTSPSASARFVKHAARVHRIPLRVRDDRDTPLVGTRRRGF